ncbi:hypothetical protein MJT46_008455 [Ovis ammon polii x Ovis aries]|nr:hypothetical protein MJT46_008455 [Ovis ammon polii x Ovis aries]
MERKRGRPAPQKPPRTHRRTQSQAATELSTPASDPEPREPLPLRQQENLEPSTAEYRGEEAAAVHSALGNGKDSVGTFKMSSAKRSPFGKSVQNLQRPSPRESSAAERVATRSTMAPEPPESPVALFAKEQKEAVAPGELSSRTCGNAVDNGSGTPREACGPFREGTERGRRPGRAQQQNVWQRGRQWLRNPPRGLWPFSRRNRKSVPVDVADAGVTPFTSPREGSDHHHPPAREAQGRLQLALGNGKDSVGTFKMSSAKRSPFGKCVQNLQRPSPRESSAAERVATRSTMAPEPPERPVALFAKEQKEAVAPGELSSRTCGNAVDNGSGTPREACGPFREGTER